MTKTIRIILRAAAFVTDKVRDITNFLNRHAFHAERAFGLALVRALHRENLKAQSDAADLADLANLTKKVAAAAAAEAKELATANLKEIRNLNGSYAR